ncbi:MAG: nitronate monooxygenase, partial [Frankiales bacterium]|nr:nitronate monooxygenase [Frankiales bacterium]
MIRTWLTNTFGLDVPVVSAPMAGVSGGALAAAVSAAGGLGLVGFASGT